MKRVDWKSGLGKLIISFGIFGMAIVGVTTPSTDAKVVLHDENGKYVEVGGRIQVQYHMEDPEVGNSTDELFFRRLRPYIAGSLYEGWYGKFQIDFGKADFGVRDAYMQYSGWKHIKLVVGNYSFPFSREFLTSSKKQQLVERTFVGDHDYGTPDRTLGVHLTGSFLDKKLTYGASAAGNAIDPDNTKLDFDTPVNLSADFNQGAIVGGRIDFHPLGYLKMEQGDFKRKTLATIGAAAFSWRNDDDNNISPNEDVDSVTGFEISGAFRGFGFSVDAEYNQFDAKLVDPGVNSGIYKNSESDLNNYALKGGYMILPSTLELIAAYQVQTAESYAKDWTRTSVGLNYFIKKHDIKLQGTYRIGANKDGVDGNDLNEIFIQSQFVF